MRTLPRASAHLARAALVQLLVGATLGAAVLAGAAVIPWLSWTARTVPAHGELLLMGFMAQFVLAIATWILPRPVGSGEARAPLRGGLAWCWLLNAGVAGAALALCLPGARGLLAPARLAEAVALAALAWQLLPRVRAALLEGRN